MSMEQSSAKAYQKTSNYSGVLYADPHSLIVQMFDGALQRIAQAKGAMERSDIAEKATLIGKAITIIASLDACLDHEKGGGISTNLSELYTYMNLTLTQANIDNNPQKLEEIISLLLEIKSAWAQIPQQLARTAS